MCIQQVILNTEELVKKAGKLLLSFEEMSIEQKTSQQDIVTKYDREVELFLTEHLTQIVPDSTIVGEENLKNFSESMWIIDPIDGTTNFCNLHQDFTISVAYYKDYQPVFGIVYDVVRENMYLAVHGQGAFINGSAVSVGNVPCIRENGLFDASLGTLQEWKSLFFVYSSMRGHRSCGCASLAIIYVALEKLDFYASSHVKVWDYAAACIFLQELNGQWEMERDFFSIKKNRSIFVRDTKVLTWLND